MSDPIQDIDTDTLRALLRECQEALRRVTTMDAESADVEAIRCLLKSQDLVSEFESLVQYDRAIAGRILHAALTALANTQTVLAIKAELTRRAAANN